MNSEEDLQIIDNEECDEEVVEYFDVENSQSEYFSIEESPRISEDSTGENEDNPSKKISNCTALKPTFPSEEIEKIKAGIVYKNIEMITNSNQFNTISELTFMDKHREERKYNDSSSSEMRINIESTVNILPSNVIPMYDTDSRDQEPNSNPKESNFNTKDLAEFGSIEKPLDDYDNIVNFESLHAEEVSKINENKRANDSNKSSNKSNNEIKEHESISNQNINKDQLLQKENKFKKKKIQKSSKKAHKFEKYLNLASKRSKRDDSSRSIQDYYNYK